MMLIGGGRMSGIHGAHFGPGIEIHYAAADAKRQIIPWVQYRNSSINGFRTYWVQDAKPEVIEAADASVSGVPACIELLTMLADRLSNGRR